MPFIHKIKLLLPSPLALPPNSSPVFQASLSPLSVLCILVVSFIWSTLTLIVSKLDLLFVNYTHIHFPSLRSTINSITYSIICYVCGSGFSSAPPAINKAAVISPVNHVYALLTVCIYRLFMNNLQCLVPNRPILAPYNPICTPISHCFTRVCCQSHLTKTCAVNAARISGLFIFVWKKITFMCCTHYDAIF